MKTVLLGNNMYVMTQAPEKGEEPCLPHGLSMVNTHTEMTTGNRCVTVMIKNQTAALIIIGNGIRVAWVVTANRVPPVEVMPGALESWTKCGEFSKLGGLFSVERRWSYAARFIRTMRGGLVQTVHLLMLC